MYTQIQYSSGNEIFMVTCKKKEYLQQTKRKGRTKEWLQQIQRSDLDLKNSDNLKLKDPFVFRVNQ